MKSLVVANDVDNQALPNDGPVVGRALDLAGIERDGPAREFALPVAPEFRRARSSIAIFDF